MSHQVVLREVGVMLAGWVVYLLRGSALFVETVGVVLLLLLLAVGQPTLGMTE